MRLCPGGRPYMYGQKITTPKKEPVRFVKQGIVHMNAMVVANEKESHATSFDAFPVGNNSTPV